MFRKLLRVFFIVFGLAALSVSTSQAFMNFVAEQRNNNDWWGYDQQSGGNLAGISDLGFLKFFYSPAHEHAKRAVYSGPKNSVLYLFGDSYTWSLQDTNFAGIADYKFISRYTGGFYRLDTTKKNILVIEVTELQIRKYFRTLKIFNEFRDSAENIPATAVLDVPGRKPRALYAALFPDLSGSLIFNKNINQNLQANLFNYNFIMPVFRYKAALNYYVFGRASGNVIISKDRKFLFYKESVSWTDTGGSYATLIPGEITRLVQNLNAIYDHYKAAGFSEVYVSLIPNTASLMQPEGYNNLIPLIESDARLRMKMIDVYYTFKKSPRLLFHRGDSHWNLEGEQKWVDMVNEKLTKGFN